MEIQFSTNRSLYCFYNITVSYQSGAACVGCYVIEDTTPTKLEVHIWFGLRGKINTVICS